MSVKNRSIISEEKSSLLTQEKLEAFLWKSAEILRGSIDSSEYKHYIFGLLFLKRLSDQFEEELRTHGDNPNDPDPDSYQFFVPKSARWSTIREKSEAIGNAIDKAFATLEENNSILEDVLVPIQFEDPKRLTDNILQRLVTHFSKDDFNLANSNMANSDMFGRAYEYLIKQFADDSGKKGGEFYTPTGVVKVLVRILNPQERMRICDPACGSGGMLIECVNYLKKKGKNFKNLALFGKEKNRNTWAISKMNLLLHDVLDAEIEHGCTMNNPLSEDGRLMLFDVVIANPMWNQKEWGQKLFKQGDPYNRVIFEIPPKNSGDWMWVQHMFSTLKEGGRMGVVLDNGALFRASKEKAIRKGFVEKDWIEGIIALPKKLFYNTGSPGCLIIFNKSKTKDIENKIFFIHAENEFLSEKAQNYLKEEHIKKISETYQRKAVVEKFSIFIDKNEIRENDYNLNVSRYVDILPEEELVEIEDCISNIRKVVEERDRLEPIFHKNLRQLGYK